MSEKFELPEMKITRFDLRDILTASGESETTKPSGPINPELPPDDDFDD